MLVPIPDGPLNTDVIQSAFDRAYLNAYGRLLQGIPVRVMNYRVSVTGKRPAFDMAAFAPPTTHAVDQCRTATRTVRCCGTDHATPVYDRLNLPEGARIAGPALLEQPDTTIFIDPGLTGEVDRFGNLILRAEDEDG